MKLICIAGLPGTGKTHLAMRLASETGAVRLSRDEIRAKLFNQPNYTDSEKSLAFNAMLFLARYFLSQQRDVILEGMPFSRRSERGAARALAKEMGAEFELLYCVCPEEIALKRIASQEHPAADRNEELYFRVKARFEPIGEDEEAVVVNTG
ncbi:MAG: AAA family ATPase [Armatimonadota bacterium]|nr:AAA family ATPase [Armatimonadota bacterium]